jgi:co-chaperonin GroES (HSP10)
MSLPLFHDRILIRKLPPPEQYTSSDGRSKSGIIIPTSEKEKHRPNMGVVLGVGPGVNLDGVKPGVEVLFEKFAGAEVMITGPDGVLIKDLLIIRAEDLISGYANDGYFYENLLAPYMEKENAVKEQEEKFAEEQRKKKEAESEEAANRRMQEWRCECKECSKKFMVVVIPSAEKEPICEFCGNNLERVGLGVVVVGGGTPNFHG